jgi:hypothetical protein
MFLNIILTLLVIILGTMTIMLYLWWKKYGKTMFDTMKGFKTPLPNIKQPDIKDIQEMANKLNQLFKK